MRITTHCAEGLNGKSYLGAPCSMWLLLLAWVRLLSVVAAHCANEVRSLDHARLQAKTCRSMLSNSLTLLLSIKFGLFGPIISLQGIRCRQFFFWGGGSLDEFDKVLGPQIFHLRWPFLQNSPRSKWGGGSKNILGTPLTWYD